MMSDFGSADSLSTAVDGQSVRRHAGSGPANIPWHPLDLGVFTAPAGETSLLSPWREAKLPRNFSRDCCFARSSAVIFLPLCLSAVTFSEAQQAKLELHGLSPMPRDLAFPVPKGEKWHDLYDHIW